MSQPERVVSDYVRYAREDGASWRDIGKAMGLERAAEDTGGDLAELAFQKATGQRLGSDRDEDQAEGPTEPEQEWDQFGPPLRITDFSLGEGEP